MDTHSKTMLADAIIITGEATYNTSQIEFLLFFLEVHDLIIFTTSTVKCSAAINK